MANDTSRIGMRFFLFYLLLYGGFVFLNALYPEIMESTPLESFPGVNLAILFGFGLIFIAFILALLYGILCKENRIESSQSNANSPSSSKSNTKVNTKEVQE